MTLLMMNIYSLFDIYAEQRYHMIANERKLSIDIMDVRKRRLSCCILLYARYVGRKVR